MKHRLALAGLLLATLLAYQPAWHGGVLWDDDGHLTRADLQSTSGLARIWLSPGATQQYYPVVHSAFWVFNQFWGHDTLGYHVVNVTLHATTAWLVGLVILRLAVPGAWLAAFLFALHPVHVESVAWISELKNVLSGTFYAATALAYLRYVDSRSTRQYGGAAMLFVLAVLSKSVTATLPIALLVVVWWRKGSLNWRHDVRPLIPFVAIGAVAGLTTVWFERTLIGAAGAEFELSFIERGLVAGRALCFYAGKLLWPAPLIFIYPRWEIDAGNWTSYLCPAVVVAVLAATWIIRGRTRAPFAAVAFFCMTLFPALGFFNVYPFRFSFVADHFQYLGSIGLIVLGAAAVATRLSAALNPSVAAFIMACVVIPPAALTWRQAHDYADAESLYRATIARNPAAFLAHNNLAALLLEGDPPADRVREATSHAETAVRIKPDYRHAHYNLGTAYERSGQLEAAAAAYRRVLSLDPREPRALYRLGIVLHDAATASLQLGLALEGRGEVDQAVTHYRRAATLDPRRAAIARALGRALHRSGSLEEAVGAYRQTLTLGGGTFDVHNDLGVALIQLGRPEEAVTHFREAVRLQPHDEGARANLARATGLVRERPPSAASSRR